MKDFLKIFNKNIIVQNTENKLVLSLIKICVASAHSGWEDKIYMQEPVRIT